MAAEPLRAVGRQLRGDGHLRPAPLGKRGGIEIDRGLARELREVGSGGGGRMLRSAKGVQGSDLEASCRRLGVVLVLHWHCTGILQALCG